MHEAETAIQQELARKDLSEIFTRCDNKGQNELFNEAVNHIMEEARRDEEIKKLQQAEDNGKTHVPGSEPGIMVDVQQRLAHLNMEVATNNMLRGDGSLDQSPEANAVAQIQTMLVDTLHKHGFSKADIMQVGWKKNK